MTGEGSRALRAWGEPDCAAAIRMVKVWTRIPRDLVGTKMTSPTMLRASGPFPIAMMAFLACAAASSEVRAQDVKRCETLNRFLIDTMEMEAETSPDSVDDWRTRKILPGCRVTAAGSALREVPGEENEVFYLSLIAAGWTRTPDPHDRPHEAAIRLRLDGTDCFFTPYQGHQARDGSRDAGEYGLQDSPRGRPLQLSRPMRRGPASGALKMSDDSVFGEVDRYIADLFAPTDAALAAAERSIEEAGMPHISVSPTEGKLLHLLALLCNAGRILEIGTLAGYSTIWMARALPPGGRLITIEGNPAHAEGSEE